jgi:hypothetical protein
LLAANLIAANKLAANSVSMSVPGDGAVLGVVGLVLPDGTYPEIAHEGIVTNARASGHRRV